MDGFSFHPYPNEATDPLERGYQWPNAGFANLDRVKQALWDAFDGTAQPTTLDGLKLHLDEVGWQVDTSGARRLSRARERACDGRGDAGGDLRAADPRGRVRPGCRVAQLLRLPRRRAAHGLPGGPRARGREFATVRRRRAARRFPTAASGSYAHVGARRSTSSARRSPSAARAGGNCSRRRRGGRPREGVRPRRVVRALGARRAAAPSPCRGRRSLDVAVRAPAGATGWVEVAVQFAAESNRARRTLVVASARS